MRVKLQKSVILAYDYRAHEDLQMEDIWCNGEVLVSIPANESFLYLGVRASLAGRKGSIGPDTADEIQHVFSSTRKLNRSLALHQIPLWFVVPAMRMVAAARLSVW